MTLSSVTKTIIRLLQLGLDPSEFESPSSVPTIQVSAIPPDEVQSNLRKEVSVHLLHLMETPEYKNAPLGPRLRKSPIQQLPLGLVLQYVISVAREESQGDGSTSDDATFAQDILGRAAQIIHDFPIITKSTEVPVGDPPEPIPVFDGDLADGEERLELILRPALLEENLNFWATQNQKLARACLFVEARVAILQPKPPEILTGTVLSVGNFIFPNAGPQLGASSNTLSFQPPKSLAYSKVLASPARVAMFPNDPTLDAGPIKDNCKLTIEAIGLSPGKRVLVLRTETQKLAIDLDQPDLANALWKFAQPSGALTLHFRNEVRARIGSPPALTTVRLAPGIYGARVQLEDDRLGTPPRPRVSNEIAFAVVPQIRSVVATPGLTPSQPNHYTLEVEASCLDFPAPPPGVVVPPAPEIDLSVGGQVLTRVPSATAIVDGQFRVENPSAITFKLFDPSVTIDLDHPLPIQLFVNGGASTPFWLTVKDLV